MGCCETKGDGGCCRDLNKSALFKDMNKKSVSEKTKEMRINDFQSFATRKLHNEMKGGERKMDSRITLWIVIGVLFVTALFLTFKAGAVGSVEGVQVASTAAKTAVSSSGMVGGC